MRRFTTLAGALCVALFTATGAFAQAQPPAAPPSYGTPITLEQARKVAAAAEAEAVKNNFKVAIAIVETNGQIVLLQKMDDTQYAAVNVAIGKAKSAALYRRPTDVFNDLLGKGNTYLMGLEGANMVPGGHPIVAGGKIIGAIGVSGGTGAQDTQVAKAGLTALQ